MAKIEPSQFYTGLVAELYGPLRSMVPDPEPYARFVAHVGEPALELGCGDGDPMLELRARGLDVEGLDSSGDMLDRCRRRAIERGLDVVLHEQSMETMELGRRYRSIYLAGPTFNLLPDDNVAASALARIAAHLEPGGSALIPLFVPAVTAPSALGIPKSHTTPDGVELRVTIVAEDRDEERRCQTATLRYERITENASQQEERAWLLHWYTQDGFRQLAADAGLVVRAVVGADGRPAAPDEQMFIFRLRRPE